MQSINELNLLQTLQQGCEELNIKLDQSQFEQLVHFMQLLCKWNAVYNLTAIRQPEQMVTQHLLDSLAVVPSIKGANTILDVGSGGGLPGLVLAIACPEKHISLIDTVQKKTAFLNQAKAELGLPNVSVYTGPVEALKLENQFDVVTSRAFSDLATFVNLSGHLLSKKGCFIAMKGAFPQQEMDKLPDNYKVKEVKTVRVPGLNAQRHLVFIQREVN